MNKFINLILLLLLFYIYLLMQPPYQALPDSDFVFVPPYSFLFFL